MTTTKRSDLCGWRIIIFAAIFSQLRSPTQRRTRIRHSRYECCAEARAPARIRKLRGAGYIAHHGREAFFGVSARSVNCRNSVRCRRWLKLSSEMRETMVSPAVPWWMAMPSMLSISKLESP